MTPEQQAALRRPFDAKTIGKLPKGNAMLDFVGHAAVTDRLLAVDPEWTWEPFAVGEDGLPAYQNGGLWIRLTVCGVTRVGFGDGPDPKQRIGDAIRNAAMRFGVALDLWSRQELEGIDPNGGDPSARTFTAEAYRVKHPETPTEEMSSSEVVEPPPVPEVLVSPGTEGDGGPDKTALVAEAVAALRQRVLDAMQHRNRNEALQMLTRISMEAGQAKLLNEQTTSPAGAPLTLNVLIDEGVKHRTRSAT